jgi:hypothetical protein
MPGVTADVLVVAFDSCDPGLVAEMISDGELPNLAEMLTQDTDPVALPVIAAYYTTDRTDWLTLCAPEVADRTRQEIIDKWNGH